MENQLRSSPLWSGYDLEAHEAAGKLRDQTPEHQDQLLVGTGVPTDGDPRVLVVGAHQG
ncbi:MAG: hypothetical protein KC619_31530 [Myxococcales bacterium]|nr:hypothetical protein [Myxococcales bacterium]